MHQRIAELEQENTRLQQQVTRYTRELEAADRTMQQMQAEHQEVRQEQQHITELEQENARLQQQVERLSTMLETASDWAWEVDMHGIYTYVSPGTTRIIGYAPEEVIGKTPFDLMPQEEAERVRTIFGPIIASQAPIQDLENVVLHKAGHPLVMATSGVPFFTPDGEFAGYRGVDQNITEHAQLEEQLQQSQMMLQLMIDNLPATVYAVDRKHRLVLANRQWAAAVGRSVEQSIGKTSPELFGEELGTVWMTKIQHILDAGLVDEEEEVISLADEPRTYRSVRFPLRDDAGRVYGLGGIATDITERKQAERDLRFAQHTLEQAADGIFWNDMTGKTIYVNAAACTNLGYTRETLQGMNILDFDPEITQDMLMQIFEQIREMKAVRIERTHRRSDGSLMPVEINAAYFTFEGQELICSFVRDITERKQQEETLRAFKALVDTSPDGIGIATLDGSITYANPAFQSLSGYGESLTGMNFLAIYPEEQHATVATAAQHVAAHGSWQGDLIVQRAAGQQVPVQLTSFIIDDAEGQPVSMTGVFRDLTEQRRAEAERAALQQQIIDTQRAAIRELSTPLIPLTETAMVMPLIGVIDTQRAQQIMETLLDGAAQHQARLVILDITGVQVVDTQVAQTFIQAAQAVKLLGAQVMLTGIQPQIAQTLVHLGVDLRGIQTQSSLQAGIAAALHGTIHRCKGREKQ
jgi:rsbT co-antagonist protein RsbR